MTSPLSPEAVEAHELLAGLTPLELDQYAGLTPLERVAAATHPHISMCRLGDTRMDCITCADELHRIRAYLAAVSPVVRAGVVAELVETLEGVYVGNPMSSLYTAGKKDGYMEAAGTVRHHYDADNVEARERPAPRHAAPDEGIGDDGAPVAEGPESEVSGA